MTVRGAGQDGETGAFICIPKGKKSLKLYSQNLDTKYQSPIFQRGKYSILREAINLPMCLICSAMKIPCILHGNLSMTRRSLKTGTRFFSQKQRNKGQYSFEKILHWRLVI